MEANIVGHKLHYTVTFPIQNPLPRLKGLMYNGTIICSDENDKEYFSQTTIIRLSHTYSIPYSNSPLMTSASSVIMSKPQAASM